MNIKTDRFIKTGKTHFICQDYILTGTEPQCIILADGCSAVENSDIGARLLCLAAAKYLRTYQSYLGELEYIKMGQQIIFNAEVAALAAGISPMCLTATLMVAFYFDGYIHVVAYGDGNVILLDNNDSLYFHEISYSDSRPFYLSYYLHPNNYRLYEKENIKKVVRSELGEIEYVFHHPFINTFPIKKYKTVAITSDGILSWSFPFHQMEVFKECVSYKNTNGAFLQRRMVRFISNLETKGYNHHDDISIGAFCRED